MIICVSPWRFSDEVEDHSADRTYVYNLELHQILACGPATKFVLNPTLRLCFVTVAFLLFYKNTDFQLVSIEFHQSINTTDFSTVLLQTSNTSIILKELQILHLSPLQTSNTSISLKMTFCVSKTGLKTPVCFLLTVQRRFL